MWPYPPPQILINLVAVDNRTRANHRYKFSAIGASSIGLGCATHLLSEQSDVIDTRSLLHQMHQSCDFEAMRCLTGRQPV